MPSVLDELARKRRRYRSNRCTTRTHFDPRGLLLHCPGMSARARHRRLSTRDMRAILEVTSALAAPFDLMTMLREVVAAAKQVLGADRGSVWLRDPATDELVLEVATGMKQVRVSPGVGLVGACALARRIINVPDCYSDPRFDPTV